MRYFANNVKIETRLPSVFNNGNCCLIDGFFVHERTTPPRTVGGAMFNTKLSAMREKVLSLRLDGEVHRFAEARGRVAYLPPGVDSTADLDDPRPRRVTVEMVSGQPRRADPPPRFVLPPMQIEVLDPPRVVSVHAIRAARSMTLLLIDEGLANASGNQPIAIIGDAIHWDLEGIAVSFETVDGRGVG